LRGNTSLEPYSVKIGPTILPGRRIEKKRQDRIGQDSQKSHKGVIFHLLGETPPLNRLASKFAQ